MNNHDSLPIVLSLSLRKTVGKVSPTQVTLTSRNDSDFESSNVSLKENKPDGVNPNSNDIDYYVRKNEGKILRFSADWLSQDPKCILLRTWVWTVQRNKQFSKKCHGSKTWLPKSTIFVGSMEAPSKAFLSFFLLSDWLNLNHLKSRMECGFSDIISRLICSTVVETRGMTNYAASFSANKCSENYIWSGWDDARSVEPTI